MKLQKALVIIAVFITMLAPPVFFARADTISSQTRGEIDFIAGSGPVHPLDPDYPDENLSDLAEVSITNDSDSLSLNAVPDFIFAQPDGSPFPAQLVGEKLYALYSPERPYAQISDLRGIGGGWTLSVSASSFLRDGAPALQGAELHLRGGTAHSSNPALTPPPVAPSIVIECGGEAAPVTVADATGGGMGAWIIRWYAVDDRSRFSSLTPALAVGVELYVPADAIVLPGNYTATLYWTLSDVA